MIVIPVKNKLDLYQKFPGENKPQPCYIEFDPRLNRIIAEANPVLGNTISEDYANGKVFRYALPYPIYAEVATKLMESLLPQFKELANEFTMVWDGQKYVGKLTEKGTEINDNILIDVEEHILDCYDQINVYSAEEWFTDPDAYVLEEISINTTDEEIIVIIEEELRIWSNSVDIIEGAEKYLKGIRDNFQDEEYNLYLKLHEKYKD